MRHILLLVFGLLLTNAWAQPYPPLEITADHEFTTSPASVEVPIRAGTNWQNITAIGGTIIFDTTIITYDQISYFGLSNPRGATFTYVGGGVLTYQWFSLISIGPTLNAGDIVFTIKFNAVGNVGDVSPVAFTFLPQNEYWNNGFGWSGGYASTDGSVTISCAPIGGGYTSAITGNTTCFTDTTAGGLAWQWDFGDGNTSTQQNPCHTYANPGNYTACMIVTDTCGNDTICSNVYICGPPILDWSVNTIEYIADFTDLTSNIPTNWLWDFGDGNTSSQQNPVHQNTTTGSYAVCLTSWNACGIDSTCSTVTITCPSQHQVGHSRTTVWQRSFPINL
ncbi:MAG: PKD domain-containing protein [Crocinitomicaceae bacterium]|nr:PKD domain-containing protein [Crocinitomicaceae bacterium]